MSRGVTKFIFCVIICVLVAVVIYTTVSQRRSQQILPINVEVKQLQSADAITSNNPIQKRIQPTASNIKKLGTVNVSCLSNKFELTPAVVEILELDDTQVHLINSKFKDALNRLKTLESTHMALKNTQQGDEYLEISAFPSEGESIISMLSSDLSEILGNESSEIITKKLDKVGMYGNFGKYRRELFIEGNAPNLMLHDYSFYSDGRRGAGGADRIDAGSLPEMRLRYGHLFTSL